MIGVVLCLMVMLVLQIATPYWWWIMIVPFGYALMALNSGWQGFRTGLISAGLLWLAAALYAFMISGDIVAGRVSAMLQLGGAGWMAVLVTAIVASLAGGLAGASGAMLKIAISGKK